MYLFKPIVVLCCSRMVVKNPNVYVLMAVAGSTLVADALWLGWVSSPMYHAFRMALNPGVSPSKLPFRLIPAILAYLAMIISLSWLVVPNISNKTLVDRFQSALFWGTLWGIGVYGTYNATNLATIGTYPPMTAMIDTMWGIVVGIIGGFMGSLVI